jgi:hypothetical protein
MESRDQKDQGLRPTREGELLKSLSQPMAGYFSVYLTYQLWQEAYIGGSWSRLAMRTYVKKKK